jgi:hypothetical protein
MAMLILHDTSGRHPQQERQAAVADSARIVALRNGNGIGEMTWGNDLGKSERQLHSIEAVLQYKRRTTQEYIL